MCTTHIILIKKNARIRASSATIMSGWGVHVCASLSVYSVNQNVNRHWKLVSVGLQNVKRANAQYTLEYTRIRGTSFYL